MKDDEIIAYQARKIIDIEVRIAHSVESERQLLEILRGAGDRGGAGCLASQLADAAESACPAFLRTSR